MSQTVTTFKDDITPKLHGTSLSKISQVYAKMREAGNVLLSKVRPRTVVRRTRIESAIYDRVYNYTCPTDCDADSIIDLRPLGERSTEDEVLGGYLRDFDINKTENQALVEYINGTKTLRLSKPVGRTVTLHRGDSTSLEGSVTFAGDATFTDIDTLDYVSGSGSMNFSLDGLTGSATITYVLDTAIDISDMEDVGALFQWFKFPDATRLTSLDLKWGSSSGVYWNKTATAAHDRAWETNAWQLVRHDWNTASETGSPSEDDAEAIDYLQVTITYDTGTALANCRIDSITASKGAAYELVYYSNKIFTDTTGVTWKETPTADTDIIQLDGDGYNIFMAEFMLTLQQELKGEDMKVDYAFFAKQLGNVGDDANQPSGMYARYAEKHPDESLIRQVEYYTFDSLNGT